MDDNGPRRWPVQRGRRGVVRATVLEVKALRQLEVELYRRALERALERITQRDVNLRAVERAVARVKFPLSRVVLVECTLQLLQRRRVSADKMGELTATNLFSNVPRLDLPEVVFGPRRQLELEIEAEDTIDVPHEVE